MRALMVAVTILCVVGCGKRGDDPPPAKGSGEPAPGSGTGSAPAPARTPTAAGGSCQVIKDLCTKIPLAELAKIFEAPGLASKPQQQLVPEDAPAGPHQICHYESSEPHVSFDVTYACRHAGAERTKSDYDMAKNMLSSAGTTVEVPGIGEEAFFNATSTATLPFVMGTLATRRGNVYVDLTKYSHHVGPSNDPISAETARAHATAAVKRLLEFVSAPP